MTREGDGAEVGLGALTQQALPRPVRAAFSGPAPAFHPAWRGQKTLTNVTGPLPAQPT